MNTDNSNDRKQGACRKADAEIEPDVHTVECAALRLSTSTRSVWRLISRGELKTVQIGRSVRVTRASIDEFIEKGGTQ